MYKFCTLYNDFECNVFGKIYCIANINYYILPNSNIKKYILHKM